MGPWNIRAFDFYVKSNGKSLKEITEAGWQHDQTRMKTTITTLWLHYDKDKSRCGETSEEAIAEAQGRISSDFD